VSQALRIGIDLGGTKIAGIALKPDGVIAAELRVPAPQGDYDATVRAIGAAVTRLESTAAAQGSIGVGMPGSLSPVSGRVQNANSTWLNGRPLDKDVIGLIGRPVRFANDANCFALSEALDGAGQDARSVFGVILGTGCGGGLVFERRLIDGPHATGGEWGHNPLPWMTAEEYPGPKCWCGRKSCMEMWLSGTGLAADHLRVTGQRLRAEEVQAAAAAGDAAAQATLDRHANRLARGLAHVINIFDPEVVVLGGGLSKLAHLYSAVPPLAAPYVFSEEKAIDIRPPRWGDASGVRGAARLW
jgi:fructokinase